MTIISNICALSLQFQNQSLFQLLRRRSSLFGKRSMLSKLPWRGQRASPPLPFTMVLLLPPVCPITDTFWQELSKYVGWTFRKSNFEIEVLTKLILEFYYRILWLDSLTSKGSMWAVVLDGIVTVCLLSSRLTSKRASRLASRFLKWVSPSTTPFADLL